MDFGDMMALEMHRFSCAHLADDRSHLFVQNTFGSRTLVSSSRCVCPQCSASSSQDWSAVLIIRFLKSNLFKRHRNNFPVIHFSSTLHVSVLWPVPHRRMCLRPRPPPPRSASPHLWQPRPIHHPCKPDSEFWPKILISCKGWSSVAPWQLWETVSWRWHENTCLEFHKWDSGVKKTKRFHQSSVSECDVICWPLQQTVNLICEVTMWINLFFLFFLICVTLMPAFEHNCWLRNYRLGCTMYVHRPRDSQRKVVLAKECVQWVRTVQKVTIWKNYQIFISWIWGLVCIPVYTAPVFKGLWLLAGNSNVPLWSSLLIDSPTAADAAADSVEGKGNTWQGPISVLREREKCGGC